jgi:hypothetical protein
MTRKTTRPTNPPETLTLADRYTEVLRLREQVLHAESDKSATCQAYISLQTTNSDSVSIRKRH